MNVVTMLQNTIKSKIIPVWSKVKKWFSPEVLWNKAGGFLRIKLLKNLDIHPRDAKDYYGIGRWMVSRRLVQAWLLGIGILSFCYLWMMKPVHLFGAGEEARTYRYHSIPLKFYDGPVKILGKSGYTAYVGEVKGGMVQGNGTLYGPKGNIVYQGEFSENKYNGEGKLNYPENLLEYEGEFLNNRFQGNGTKYRKNGIKEYEGEFSQGLRQGDGILYGDTGKAVYTGKFQDDEIAYEELVGITTAEAAEMYKGDRRIYTDNSNFQVCVAMPDIQAVYCGETEQNGLQEEWKISGVYVLKNTFRGGGKQLSTTEELTEYFGKVFYEGNTDAVFGDVVALSQLTEIEQSFGRYPKLDSVREFSDVEEVEGFEDTYPLYVTAYTDEKYRYIFFSDKKRPEFFFYLVESEKDSG